MAELALIATSTRSLQAEVSTAAKAGFTLANPTPRGLVRELSADRPDTTESPITVDAGHFQMETSFFDYSRERENGTRDDTRTFFETNLKLGLTHRVDLQFAFSPHTIERTKANGGISESTRGFDDVTLRLKVNLWGNDAHDPQTPHGLESTALALMPFLILPTGGELSSGHVQGGLIIPLAVELTEQIGLGLMAEIDFVHDESDSRYDLEFVHTAVLGFNIIGPVGGYIEYAGILSSDGDARYIAFLSTGLTVALSQDLLLDVGLRRGLTSAAEDVGVFTGITVRF